MSAQFSNNNQQIKLYRNPISGHCHRIELMLSLLDIPYETIDLDMINGYRMIPCKRYKYNVGCLLQPVK